MKNYPKRYIPESIDNYLKNNTHNFIKWDKNLNSEIITLDYDGLVIACDTILRVSGSRDIDKNNFCEIQKDLFFKILNNDYVDYIDYLKECKIIISDNQYEKGVKSIGYKINEDFIDNLSSIEISNKTFNKRTLNAVKSTDKLKVSKDHINNFKSSFKIDYNAASQYLLNCYSNRVKDHKGRVLNKYTKTILQHKLLQIKDGQLWINRSDSNGRINSNLTILNGDYKQFIVGYDYNIDIKNSQPLILSLFIDYVAGLSGKLSQVYSTNSISSSQINSLSSLASYVYKILSKNLQKTTLIRLIEDLESMNLPLKSEIETWRNLCQRGELYEYFQTEIKQKIGRVVSRPEVKEIMFVNMYSSNKNQNEYKKLFSAIFPQIYKFISKIKSLLEDKRKHRILPIILQCIESYIMVEKILPQLDKMKIKYLFIHDGIILKEKDVERVELVIMQEFNYFKINPSLDIKKIK